MNKTNWIKILATSCFVLWLVALSLVNLSNKKDAPKLTTVEARWEKLATSQKKLEDATQSLNASNLDSARELVSVYAQQNLFSKAEFLAEKILQVSGDDSLTDLRMLAAIERQKGDYKKCLQTLEAITKLDESTALSNKLNATTWRQDQINLGTVYYLNGLSMEKTDDRKTNFRRAKECFQSAEKGMVSGANQSAEFLSLRETSKLNERELAKFEQN
jgi:hypothetical protein